MKNFAGICLILSLAACASAEQKPLGKWNVKATTESQKRIWITKADGSRQCAPREKAMSPQLAAQELKTAGIMVFQSRNGSDGQMHAQKCGAPTGSTVDVEISRPDLSRALNYGFVSKTMAE